MLIFLIAIIIGLMLGLFININIPVVYYPYLTLIILASIDNIIAASHARYVRSYSNLYFAFKWITDIILVIVINALGDLIGVDLTTPIIIYFGISMFSNLNKIRRSWFKREQRRRNIINIWLNQTDNNSDLPVEKIDINSAKQSDAIRLRNKAKELRIEADLLLNEADKLEEEEAIEQLNKSSNSKITSHKNKYYGKNNDLSENIDSKDLQTYDINEDITMKNKNIKEEENIKNIR